MSRGAEARANRAADVAHGVVVGASDDPEGREHDALGEGAAAIQVLQHAEKAVEVLLCEHRGKWCAGFRRGFA